MNTDNPYNFVPLTPTGRNEDNTANTYYPDDMIKIYEQQFLTEVPEDKLTEFLPALKAFYDIDDHTLDVSAVIFDAIADFCIIYNHKIKTGRYKILGNLVKENIEAEVGNVEKQEQAYTLDCQQNFIVNDIELPYHFNLFIQGDSYSTLPDKNTVLEQMYWLVSDSYEENAPDNTEILTSINHQLAGLGIREMNVTTVHEIVNYIEDNIMNEDMIDGVNALLDAAE